MKHSKKFHRKGGYTRQWLWGEYIKHGYNKTMRFEKFAKMTMNNLFLNEEQ
jgi:hypothetical protein